MATRLIFVCHGQYEHEKAHGLALRDLINGTTGFTAFFAEAVHDTDGLSQHIFGNLERCDGFLAVMHRRGEVDFFGRRFHRASVWVQQELAIVSFLNQLRSARRRIKVQVFAQRAIEREGLANTLILNPTEFDRDEELAEQVVNWLKGPDFADDPVNDTREVLFERIIANLRVEHWRYLEILMALSRGEADPVPEGRVAAMLGRMGFGEGGPWQDQVKEDLGVWGIVVRNPNPRTGSGPININPAFVDLLADEFRKRGSFHR